MKIAFVWYYDKASGTFTNWRDGLRGAMEEIQKRGHEVNWFFDKSEPLPEDNYDAIILWDDTHSQFIQELYKFNCKKGLCLTTDPHNTDALKAFDAVFCESDPVYEAVRRSGARAIKAFGTDTDFYTPNETISKSVEYFYPATFSPWKRQSDIAYLGPKLVCIGTIQPDGSAEYNKCVDAGVRVELGYYPAEYIRDYYNKTENVIIPAVHGSERTILEAMSMNILPQVMYPETNRKAYSFIKEFKESKLKTPREFILKNYSHRLYADQIMKGISEN